MHFLTPHVEISMADNNENFNVTTTNQKKSFSLRHQPLNFLKFFQCDPLPTNSSSSASTSLDIQPSSCQSRPNGGSPSSPHSADSNSNNAPTSSHQTTIITSAIVQNSRHLMLDSSITPSISLIPIKQVRHDRV